MGAAPGPQSSRPPRVRARETPRPEAAGCRWLGPRSPHAGPGDPEHIADSRGTQSPRRHSPFGSHLHALSSRPASRTRNRTRGGRRGGGGESTAQETPRLGSGGEGPPPLPAPSPAHGLLEGLVRWQLGRRQGTPMPCAEGTLHTRLGQGPGDGRCPQHSPSVLAGGSHGRPNCPLGPGCGPGITWPCRVTNQTLDAQWAE